MEAPATAEPKPKKPKKPSKFSFDKCKKWFNENKALAIVSIVASVIIIALLVVLLSGSSDSDPDVDVDINVSADSLEINSIEDLETAKSILQGSVEDNPEEVEELENIDSDSSDE